MEIANTRLISQHIAGTKFQSAKELVSWMGAMQAQDYAMVKWAIGVRLPGSALPEIEAAIETGEIIRTHMLRPTWHFVSADDIYWMLELMAPYIKASLKSRHQELGLSEAVVAKSNAVLEKALRAEKHLSREALMAEFEKAQIAIDENRASHLLMRAELDGLICSGATKTGKQSYALLEARVPKTKPLGKEEALAKLAKKYFNSHGPATLQDFTWWSGLPVGAARQAFEMVESDFTSETIGALTYWFTGLDNIGTNQESVYLLPAFDEIIISYIDRRAALPLEDHNKAVSNNGIFRPVIVVNGQVNGIWRRTLKKDKVVIETEAFKPLDDTTKGLIEDAAIQFGHFLEKKAEIHHGK